MTRSVAWRPRGPVPAQVDAVVVGAGLGGLMCATELASRGRHVCVLEAHSQPGGYAHGFRRGGYSFDVSLHHLGGLLRPGEITRRHLEAVGVFPLLEVVPRDTLLTVDFPDERIELPAGSALETLCERFPGQAGPLRRFVQHMVELRNALTSETDDEASLALKGRYRTTTWDEVVRGTLDDDKLVALLGQLWMYVGLSPKRASANFWAKVFGSFFIDGSAHIPRAGLASAFCARLDQLGSSVHTNRPVAEILVEGGTARGVVLDNGERILAPLVISNADPHQTFFRLVPPATVSPAFQFRLQRMIPSLSAYVTFCGLDCRASDIGLPRGNYMAYHGTDLEAAYARVIDHEIDHTDWAMTSYEGVDEEPAGDKVSFFELTGPGDWLDVDANAYSVRKSKVGERLFTKYCARFPSLREHVVVHELGTPRTMVRYTRNHAGAIYGFAQSPDQANTLRLGARTPIEGLFLTGAWARPGGGYEGAMLSGMETARAALANDWQVARRPAAPSGSSIDPVIRDRARVHYGDTDATEHVYHATYLRFLDQARHRALSRWYAEVAGAGSASPARIRVERLDVRYMNAASLGDLLELELSVDEVGDRTIDLHEMVRHGDRTLVDATTRVSLLDATGQCLPVPRRFAELRVERPRHPPQPPPVDLVTGGESPLGHYLADVFHGDTDALAELTLEAALRLLERGRYEALEAAMGDLFDDLVASSRARVYRMVLERRDGAPFGTSVRIDTGAVVSSRHRVAAHQRLKRLHDGVVVLDACVEILAVDERGALAQLPAGLEERFRLARARHAAASR